MNKLSRVRSADWKSSLILQYILVSVKGFFLIIFNFILLCRHFFVPLKPSVPGLQSFSGLLMHSHDYRRPDVFEGKRVVILGAAASGQDICLEVATKAEIVYLSHKGNVPSKLPDNVKQQRPISFVSADRTVHFDDGQQRKVDAILLCTGYEFSFPFLSDACSIEVCNKQSNSSLQTHF